jgi:hypothetical protein
LVVFFEARGEHDLRDPLSSGLSIPSFSPGSVRSSHWQTFPSREMSRIVYNGPGLRKGYLVFEEVPVASDIPHDVGLMFTYACPRHHRTSDYDSVNLLCLNPERASKRYKPIDRLHTIATIEPPEHVYADILAESHEVSRRRFSMVPHSRLQAGWWSEQ